MKRLTKDGFERPVITLTDRLDEKDIKAKLVNYKRLVNLQGLLETPIGTHLRYFKKNKDEYMFRMGGILINKKFITKYVVLSNNGKTWCVDTKLCIFFARKTNTDIKDDYKKIIKEQAEQISELKSKIKNNVVKYKNMEGDLVNPYDLKKGDYVTIAHKRRKRIYEIMLIYGIDKVDDKIIKIRTMSKAMETYKFDTDDYYYYKIKPQKGSGIEASANRILDMMKW